MSIALSMQLSTANSCVSHVRNATFPAGNALLERKALSPLLQARLSLSIANHEALSSNLFLSNAK